ncbi:hypothetical protein EVAR_103993_1 [Eumeta japonica]|uniref:Uncharacterized protein n=1 Tax=Eumeta variegata TaxID=151549 RepID=A0A4C1XY14_EUMVA|nr:hypothetical protein EVAR_103993_1 [Eumeta japonica]
MLHENLLQQRRIKKNPCPEYVTKTSNTKNRCLRAGGRLATRAPPPSLAGITIQLKNAQTATSTSRHPAGPSSPARPAEESFGVKTYRLC